MFSVYTKNISKYLNLFRPSSSLLAKNKFSTSNSLSSDEEKLNYVLSEDLPPIPPNLGFPGDENIKSIYELKKINKSFQYGNPPKIRRKFIQGPTVIRLLPITNCNNRKFYRLAVTKQNYSLDDGFIEDLGSIDPMPNKDNQILVALNAERIKYYLSKSVPLKGRVGEILGLAGLLPVHPRSYLQAYRNRKKLENENTKEEKKENEN